MRKRFLKVWDLPSNGSSAALLIIAVLFLIGSVAGCALVNRVDQSGDDALTTYLEGYLSCVLSNEVARPEPLTLVWKTFRWPMVVFVLGMTPIGLLCIPILFLIRSFLLSFSVASFFHVLGLQGLVLAFIVFGISGLFQILVLLVLGIQGFLNAGAITGRLVGEGRRSSILNRSDVLRLGVCALTLFLCCLLEYYAVPAALKALSAILIGS